MPGKARRERGFTIASDKEQSAMKSIPASVAAREVKAHGPRT